MSNGWQYSLSSLFKQIFWVACAFAILRCVPLQIACLCIALAVIGAIIGAYYKRPLQGALWAIVLVVAILILIARLQIVAE